MKNKAYIYALLFCIVLSSAGCKKVIKDTLSTPTVTTPEINSSHSSEKKAPLPVSHVMADYDTMTTPKLNWFYNRLGKSTWFYEAQLHPNSFTETEYKELIKFIYTASSDDDRVLKHAATYGIQYAAYKGLQLNPDNDTFSAIKPALYSSVFIEKGIQESPSFIAYIPNSHPHFIELAINAIEANPFSFDYLLLRDKKKDSVVSSLFKSKDIFHYGDREFKQRAFSYASSKQALRFVKANGNNLQFAPETYKKDPFIVFTAINHTPSSVQYADKELQAMIQEKGIRSLVDDSSKIAKQVIPAHSESMSDGRIKTSYEFSVDRSIITDTELIERIEAKTQRELTQLWRVVLAGELGTVYVANFRPIGINYLGAIILDKGNSALFIKRYPGAFNPRKPNTIWFPEDSGIFAPENFRFLSAQDIGGKALLEMIWVQGTMTKPYQLKETNFQLKATELLF